MERSTKMNQKRIRHASDAETYTSAHKSNRLFLESPAMSTRFECLSVSPEFLSTIIRKCSFAFTKTLKEYSDFRSGRRVHTFSDKLFVKTLDERTERNFLGPNCSAAKKSRKKFAILVNRLNISTASASRTEFVIFIRSNFANTKLKQSVK